MSGLLWSNAWTGYYESYISLIWKLAWVNRLTKGQFVPRYAVPRQNGLANRALEPLPIVQTQGWHDLSHLRTTLSRALSMPGALRFCPECLRAGYVSVFHQYAILKRCPIHGELLTDRCQCGAPTPDYCHLNQGVAHPFHCGSCGGALAGLFEPRDFFERGKAIHAHEEAFAPLADWTMRLSAGQWEIKGTIYEAWCLGRCLEPKPDANAAMQRFVAGEISEALMALEPLDIPADCLQRAHGPLTPVAFGYRTCEGLPARYRWRNEKWWRQMYNVVGRHIRRRVLGGLKRHRQLYACEPGESWGATQFVPPPGVHPLMHAYWLWRRHLSIDKVFYVTDIPYDMILLGNRIDTSWMWPWGELNPQSQLHYLLGIYFDFVRVVLSAIASGVPDEWTVAHMVDRAQARRIRAYADDKFPGWIVAIRPLNARLAVTRTSVTETHEYCFLYGGREVVAIARSRSR